MTDDPSVITTVDSFETYFSDLLHDALDESEVELNRRSTEYLLQLLVDLAESPESLFCDKESKTTPALADLYIRAQTISPYERSDAYRQLGDVSLTVSGLFREHIERRNSVVTIEYYINMGRSAYHSAAGSCLEKSNEELYSELSRNFLGLVDAFSVIADKTHLRAPLSISDAYDRLQNGISETGAARDLLRAGVFPVFNENFIKRTSH